MRRWLLLISVLAFLTFPVLNSSAQGGWTPEEQAALDTVQAALDSFQGITTYSASMTQTQTQDISVSYQGESITVSQAIDAAGTLLVERHDDGTSNQSYDLEETVTAQQSPNDPVTVGPIMIKVILLDGRVYLQVFGTPELADTFPTGWHDVTDGSDVPGLSMFNMEALVGQESWFIQTPAALIAAIRAIEQLEPDEQPADTYRLTVDPAAFLEAAGGPENFRNLFASNQLPFDVDLLVERLFTDEDTTIQVDVMVGEDGSLYGYQGEISADIELGDLITDPSLAGAELNLSQTTITRMMLYDLNEPVDIQAPVLDE